MGENLKVVWAEFSTFKFGSFTENTKIVQHANATLLKLKTRPRFGPVS